MLYDTEDSKNEAAIFIVARSSQIFGVEQHGLFDANIVFVTRKHRREFASENVMFDLKQKYQNSCNNYLRTKVSKLLIMG